MGMKPRKPPAVAGLEKDSRHVVTMCRLRARDRARLEALASDHGVGYSTMMRMIVEAYLDEYAKEGASNG